MPAASPPHHLTGVLLDTPARRAAARQWHARLRRGRVRWVVRATASALAAALAAAGAATDHRGLLAASGAALAAHVADDAVDWIAARRSHPDLHGDARRHALTAFTLTAAAAALPWHHSPTVAAAGLVVAAVAPLLDPRARLAASRHTAALLADAATDHHPSGQHPHPDRAAAVLPTVPTPGETLAAAIDRHDLTDTARAALAHLPDAAPRLRRSGAALLASGALLAAAVAATALDLPEDAAHTLAGAAAVAATAVTVAGGRHAADTWSARVRSGAPTTTFAAAALAAGYLATVAHGLHTTTAAGVAAVAAGVAAVAAALRAEQLTSPPVVAAARRRGHPPR